MSSEILGALTEEPESHSTFGTFLNSRKTCKDLTSDVTRIDNLTISHYNIFLDVKQLFYNVISIRFHRRKFMGKSRIIPVLLVLILFSGGSTINVTGEAPKPFIDLAVTEVNLDEQGFIRVQIKNVGSQLLSLRQQRQIRLHVRKGKSGKTYSAVEIDPQGKLMKPGDLIIHKTGIKVLAKQSVTVFLSGCPMDNNKDNDRYHIALAVSSIKKLKTKIPIINIETMKRDQFLKLADDAPFLYDGKVISKNALEKQEKNFDMNRFTKEIAVKVNNELKSQRIKFKNQFQAEESKLIQKHSLLSKSAFQKIRQLKPIPAKFKYTGVSEALRKNEKPPPAIIKIYDDYITPKASVCILGENLGDQPGKVILTGKFLTESVQMDIIEWTNYKPRVGIVCMFKLETNRVIDHEAKLKIITAPGQSTAEVPIRFRATRELRPLNFCLVSANTTKKVRTTILIPYTNAYFTFHKGWFTSGGSGSDHYHIELINGWEFHKFNMQYWKKSGNNCSFAGPYGFNPGSNVLNMSFNWSLGWGYSKVFYIFEIYIKGPRGVRYHTGCIDCDCPNLKVTHSN